MANPTFRSSSSVADQSGATFSVTKPTGAADGDLLIAYQATSLGGGGAPATPTGWLVARAAVSWNGGINLLQCFYRVAASEGSSWTFNGPSGGMFPASTVCVVACQGPPGATPEPGSGGSGSSSTADPGAYSTLAANDLVLCAWANTFGSITPDGSFTAIGSVGMSMQLNVGYKAQAAAGAVSPRSASLGFSGAWGSALVAVAPAAASNRRRRTILLGRK